MVEFGRDYHKRSSFHIYTLVVPTGAGSHPVVVQTQVTAESFIGNL